MNYKLGSLFDGSGGFPLAGALTGIEPVWAAEVEPYPIAVTQTRFPKMEHLGDISKVSGAEIEPVDIITFGSPCQDLSVAGKRAGLKHEANGDEETTRSGLFMEAVRIIKEMREATGGQFPRWALWENVPGAFSSSKGEDFRVVLEELIRIVEPDAVMPEVPKAGWAYADSYCGNEWSLAYRVFDAQYWGVPQRRRRIHLVVDFRGECAREVLFEREGLRGYFAESGKAWQGSAGDAQNCAGATDREGESAGGDGGRQLDAVAYTLKVRSGVPVDSSGKAAGKGALVQVDKAATLAATQDQYLFQPVTRVTEQYLFENHSQDTRYKDPLDICPMLPAQLGTGGNNTPFVVEQRVFRKGTRPHSADEAQKWEPADVANTLNTFDLGEARANELVLEQKAYGISSFASNAMKSANPHSGIYEADTARTLDLNGGSPACNQGGIAIVEQRVYAVDQGGGKSGANVSERVSPTLTCTHGGEPAVAYCIGNGQADQTKLSEKVGTLDCMHDQKAVLIAIDRAFFNQGQNAQYESQCYTDGTVPTLFAKGPSAVCHKQEVRYIVRRLTPTECARLQGFADRWGDIKAVDTFTQKEYQFWLNVRNTHAAINGKVVKDYAVQQMLTWYNKLQTDSAEYKMWGNGIALPPALYCMQGIVEAMEKETEEDDAWML